ncbi:MAG: hypothetical protein QME87_09940 [Bacillota bacterium]|nr:hypothetical protein [Bacillota bacterium]
MALAYVGRGGTGPGVPGVLRKLASLDVQDLLLLSRIIYAEAKAGREEVEACARRLFWFRPERLARGVALLAELERMAAAEGLPVDGQAGGSEAPGCLRQWAAWWCVPLAGRSRGERPRVFIGLHGWSPGVRSGAGDT